MIVVIDYDTGNTRNVKKALDFLGVENELSANPQEIIQADGVILPGVGAFKKAIDALNQRQLIPVIRQVAKKGTPILGICLGMQLLFDRSLEFGNTPGLSLIKGQVVPIPTDLEVKVPHMGWDQNQMIQSDPIAAPFDRQFSYFVHSYYVQTPTENVLATVDYGIQLPSIVRQNNIIGMQFHPEKSGQVGLAGLTQFKEMVENADYSRN